MKHLKKLASIMLALAMVLAMAIPVMAEDSPSITISKVEADPLNDTTYHVYKIFELTYSDENYSYKIVESWENFFKKDPQGQLDANNFDGKGLVTLIDGTYVKAIDGVNDNSEVVQKFAQEARSYVTNNKINADATGTIPKGETSSGPITVPELGYYLVDSTVGTLCSLNSTNPTANIVDKNNEPIINKEVKEDSTDHFGKVNDAEIGQEVTFQATITAQAGATNYVMHDTMSTGLTYGEVSEIKWNDMTVLETEMVDGKEARNYTINVSSSSAPLADGCTFEIVFDPTFCSKLKANEKIVVTYTATVNSDAVAGTAIPNETTLTYGNNNKTETSETKTYVWSFDLFKRDGASTTEPKALLAGATFKLSTDEAGANTVAFSKVDDNNFKVDKAGTVTEFTTNTVDKINLSGLDEGVYYLTETNAPAGYNKLPKPYKVTIKRVDDTVNNTATCTIHLNDATEPVNAVDIENNTGTQLPSTGGIGTTVFYVAGGILVVGAAVILVSKKRTKDE